MRLFLFEQLMEDPSIKILKIILVFHSSLLFLDNFKFLVSGQLFDISGQSSIIINDKLYFLGGYSISAEYTNQTIYLDLSKSFSLNQSLPIKLITPVPIPPFNRASLTLGGSNNDTLYLISGHKNGTVPGTTAYGSIVYSINTNSFNTWTPETLNGQSLLANVSGTIYTQDNNGNVYIKGDGVNNMYKFNTNTLSFVSLNTINNSPNISTVFACHLLNDKETIIYIGENLTQVLFIVVVIISNKNDKE